MSKIILQKTKQSPEICYSEEKSELSIKGTCRPEDIECVSIPLLKWFSTFKSNPTPKLLFFVDLFYFNSASAKFLVHFFLKVKKEYSGVFKIIWVYDADDEEHFESGMEFSNIIKVDFEFVSKE